MVKPAIRRIYSGLCFCLITLFGTGLILFTKEVSSAAAAAVKLCAFTVIPSLFPFFVLSSMALSTGMTQALSRIFDLPMRYIFRLPGPCSAALITGFSGGYPAGVRTAFELYDSGLCTESQCAGLLSFCSCCGPAFIISAAGVSLLGSLRAGVIMYLCHIAAALIIGFIRGCFSPVPPKTEQKRSFRPLPFSEAFTKAVTSSFSSVISVCGFVIFFSALTAFADSCGITELLSEIISPVMPQGGDAAAKGFFEVTCGIAEAGRAPLSLRNAMTLCSLITGWGGISVIFQTFALRGDRNISLVPYIKGRIYSALLSSVLVCAASPFFLRDTGVFASPCRCGDLFIGSPMYFITVTGVYLALALLLSFCTSGRKKSRL